MGPLETMVYTAISFRLPVDLSGALLARTIRPFIHRYTRRVIMQAPKNGFFYVLDRATGELLSANAYTKVT